MKVVLFLMKRLKHLAIVIKEFIMKLVIEDLHAEVEGNEIIKGLSLELETVIFMLLWDLITGKSTLAAIIMGNPRYQVTKVQSCLIMKIS